MDEVIDGVFIGDIEDASRDDLIDENDIEHILNLSGAPNANSDTGPSYTTIKNYNYVHIPIADGKSNENAVYSYALDVLKRMFNKPGNVFVFCAVGASRSVAVTARVIAYVSDSSFDEALETIREERPIANPNPSLVEDLRNL